MSKRGLKRDWKKSMALRFDYNNMMSEYVGAKEGITTKEINSLKPYARNAAK